MSRVRCTILSPYSDQRGGAELSLIHALRVGCKYGVDFSLAVPRSGQVADIAEELGIPVCFFGQSRTRNLLSFARSVWTVKGFCKRQNSQLLLSWDAQPHFRGAVSAAVCAIPAAWFRKGCVDSSRTSRLLARLPVSSIFANSLYTAQRQASLQNELGRPRSIHVVPSGVDLDEFDPERLPSMSECRAILGLPLDKQLLVLVGRLQHWKGFHTLIEALPIVQRRHPETELVLVGGDHPSEPNYRTSLEGLAVRMGVGESVRLTGFAPHDEIVTYMQAADVMVHASVGEPFGIVVIEAMALRKPVVAASNGGPATVISDGLNGLLADPVDPVSIASKINFVLDDRSTANEIGNAARRRAELFSTEHFGRRLSDAIRSTVRGDMKPGIFLEDELALVDSVRL